MKFYEDPLYIKMCKEAKEIQEMWLPQRGDWYYGPVVVSGYGYGAKEEDEEPEPCLINYASPEDEDGYHPKVSGKDWVVFCNSAGDWDSGPIPRHRAVWLPRQDQLQEMITREHGRFSLVELFHHFANKHFYEFRSMEQLWLAYVMCLEFKRKWNPETEKWEAVDECL